MIEKITRLFPLWAVLLSLFAFFIPNIFTPLKGMIVPLLTVVMFGMGMTLTWDNFVDVIHAPSMIFLGVALQYIIMPLAGYFISLLFHLPPLLFAGMMLVGCAPGGTASNVIAYLGKGNVALSVTLTLITTLMSLFMTPLLTYLFLNNVIPVPAWEMFLSILEIVCIPVLLGTAINSFYKRRIEKIRPLLPLISIIAIVLIIAILVALNKNSLSNVEIITVLAVMLHNSVGLGLAYYVCRLFKCSEADCRAISVEVGMQNSGLSVTLAIKYFSAVAALPGAIFSIWQNLSGPLLAALWRMLDDRKHNYKKENDTIGTH